MGRRAPRRTTQADDTANLAGWLYADLLLGLAVVFLGSLTFLVVRDASADDARAPRRPAAATVEATDNDGDAPPRSRTTTTSTTTTTATRSTPDATSDHARRRPRRRRRHRSRACSTASSSSEITVHRSRRRCFARRRGRARTIAERLAERTLPRTAGSALPSCWPADRPTTRPAHAPRTMAERLNRVLPRAFRARPRHVPSSTARWTATRSTSTCSPSRELLTQPPIRRDNLQQPRKDMTTATDERGERRGRRPLLHRLRRVGLDGRQRRHRRHQPGPARAPRHDRRRPARLGQVPHRPDQLLRDR